MNNEDKQLEKTYICILAITSGLVGVIFGIAFCLILK